MRNRLALLGALLFQPVLHLICFGKMALWYDQMRGEFCVSLPCKHSLRFFPLQYVGTAGSPKFKTNRCYLGPVGVTGDSWWWWFAQSAWEHGRWNCRKGIILAEHCTSCILHKGAVRCCKYDHLATALDGQVPGYNCRMQDLDLGFWSNVQAKARVQDAQEVLDLNWGTDWKNQTHPNSMLAMEERSAKYCSPIAVGCAIVFRCIAFVLAAGYLYLFWIDSFELIYMYIFCI